MGMGSFAVVAEVARTLRKMNSKMLGADRLNKRTRRNSRLSGGETMDIISTHSCSVCGFFGVGSGICPSCGNDHWTQHGVEDATPMTTGQKAVGLVRRTVFTYWAELAAIVLALGVALTVAVETRYIDNAYMLILVPMIVATLAIAGLRIVRGEKWNTEPLS